MGWPYIGTSRRGPLAAVDLVRQKFPGLKVRVINVADLMKLQPQNHKDFDVIFTTDKPIVFAYHVCPTLIHQPTYRRTNHGNLHVRGFKKEGTTSTPFDMVMNDLDRFHLVADVIDRVPALGARAAYAKQAIRDELIEHKQYIAQHGEEYTGGPRLALGNTAGRRRHKKMSQVLPRVCVARVYLLRRCLLRYGDSGRTLATQHAGRSARGPIPRNVAYYAGRSSHGSTLSRVVYGWVLARSDRPRAMDFFAEALQSDVNDVQQGTTAEGIHLGAMAGSVDLIQRVSTGIEVRGDVLRLNPELPLELERLDLRIRYRGHSLDLRLTRDSLRVRGRDGAAEPISLCIDDKVYEFASGTRVFRLKHAAGDDGIAEVEPAAAGEAQHESNSG